MTNEIRRFALVDEQDIVDSSEYPQLDACPKVGA